MTRESPVIFGMGLGLLDSMVASIGMSSLESDRVEAAIAFFLITMVPGVLSGALLGRMAGKSRMRPVWRRLVVLVPTAWLLVALLGCCTGLVEFVLVACIPTTVGVLILERGTRHVVPPAVPPAHAQR